MTTQQQEPHPEVPRNYMSKRSHRTRWLIASVALLLVALGASIWILAYRSTFTAILPLVIFTVLGVLLALFQWLFPFSSVLSEHVSEGSQYTPVVHQAQLTITPLPAGQSPLGEAMLLNQASYRHIVGFPPLTDPRTIQQREQVVKAVFTQLSQTNITALALTGIGGAGKSTLAALVYQYTEEQRAMHTGPFLSETHWLTVDFTVTFADLISNIFEALGKPVPQLNNLAPHNQAVILFNALNTADKPRLIIFDQFENLLNWETGHARADRPGISEWLDIINSQQCMCKFLLTSRPRPIGTHEYPPTYLQEYPVRGLEITEGVALLCNRGVKGTEEELQTAVIRCEGHALSLSLLASLIHDHTLSLSLLLKDSTLWIGNIAGNLLDYIYTNQLNHVQRELLVAFSVYREPVLREAAEATITDAPRSQTSDALKALRVQHLIEPTGEGHYQLHAIIAEYAYSHFDESNELANEEARRTAHMRAAQYYQQQAVMSCPPLDERRNASDIHDLVETIWHYCRAEKWQEAYNLIEQERVFSSLKRWGSNGILLELCLLLKPRRNWSPKPSQAGAIHRYLAWTYNAMGKRERARENNEKALQLYIESRDREGQEEILAALGWSYSAQGQMTQAIACYEQARDICEEIGDRVGEGHVLNGLGRVYEVQGQRELALEYFEQALAICEEAKNPPLVGRTLSNLGHIHTDLGNYTQALGYLEQSLVIRKNMGDRRGEGVAIENLGRVYNELGQHEKAIQYFQETLTIYQFIGDRGLEGWAFHNLGWVYNRLGQYEQAKKF